MTSDNVEYEPSILEEYQPYKGVLSFSLQIDNRVSIQVITDIVNRYKGDLATHKDGPIIIMDLTYRQLEDLCSQYEQFIVYFSEVEH